MQFLEKRLHINGIGRFCARQMLCWWIVDGWVQVGGTSIHKFDEWYARCVRPVGVSVGCGRFFDQDLRSLKD